MNTPISDAELQLLQSIPSPTISNAIERFNLRDGTEGYMDSSIRCIFPQKGVMVGYAVTGRVRSGMRPSGGRREIMKPYWDQYANFPMPRIAVLQELDDPAAGAFWGEVNANIHRALGCIGLITNGTVRDLDEVRALNFQFFASGISVSHAFAHLVDFGGPVEIGGLTVRPGDLLHADQHGVVHIPSSIASEVAVASREVEQYERPIIGLCKSKEFTTEKLASLLYSETI